MFCMVYNVSKFRVASEIVRWVTTEVSDDIWQLIESKLLKNRQIANCSEEQARRNLKIGGDRRQVQSRIKVETN